MGANNSEIRVSTHKQSGMARPQDLFFAGGGPARIDGEMLALVLSKNLHRRHLSQSQKAIIIARYLQSEMGVNQFTPSPGQTQKSAAE